MAKGIAFYRDHEGIDSLKDSHETQQFVDIFNKTFDALNRKYPAEGIRINSHDFDVCLFIYNLKFKNVYLTAWLFNYS